MPKFTILCDDREKLPLFFPEQLPILCPNSLPTARNSLLIALSSRKVRMETSDYLLEGFEKVTLIERKGSLTEVAHNCLTRDGRRKFVDCCKRLRDGCERPILMLEGNPSILRVAIRPPDVQPGLAFDALYRLLREYSIELLLLPGTSHPQRRDMGELVARILVNSAMSRRLIDATSHLQQCPPPEP